MSDVLSADQLCVAAEETLKAVLPQAIQAPALAALLGDDAGTYVVKTWQQLPVADAIATAKLPAIAITSAGLVDAPRYSRSTRSWDCTWRIGVGIYDRGRDHADTQARVRNWCALIRAALQFAPTLGGAAKGLTWSGEEYALLPNRNTARTAAAGAVAFDVEAVVPKLDLTLGPSGPMPVVTSTHPALSVE